MRSFEPKPTLSEQEVTRGLRIMTMEGMASIGFSSITTSGFLAAFALALGADNFQIGILAALPFLLQFVQIPAIWMVEKFRRRKAIAVSTWLIAQLFWFPIALIPVFTEVPGSRAVSLLLAFMAARSVFSAIKNCNWNSWVRDLVPQQILGRFFSRRMAFSTAVAALFGLGAAFFVSYGYPQISRGSSLTLGYTWALLFGAFFLGLASPVLMSFQPEPLMQIAMGERLSPWKTITMPLHDKNFRKLMRFLLSWSIALNIAVPFFAVYMLTQLKLSLWTVIALSVIGQLFNILFMRVWGPFADRYGNKTVLSLSASLYLLVILGFTFTGIPGRYFLTIPLLVVLNIFAGIAGAGVSLTIATIGFKMAPREQSVPFLAGASLATNLGAGIGPLLGGLLANFFSSRKLILDLTWIDPHRTLHLGVINLAGFDFLFILTFILGLMTLNSLASLREEGASNREVVLSELRARTSAAIRSVMSVPDPNFVNMFPLSFLGRIPGIDAAIGVTAYQLADTAKAITQVTLRSGRTAVRIMRSLQEGLEQLWKTDVEPHPQLGGEIARQATRGALHAVEEDAAGTNENVTGPAVIGIIHALNKAHLNPYEAIRGAAYGAIEGASESGADLGRTAGELMEGVSQVARDLKLEEDRALEQAASGALDAAQKLGSPAVDSLKRALLPEHTKGK